jgi:hypothetical protein
VKLPFFVFHFRTHLGTQVGNRRRIVIDVTSTRSHGLICTVYYKWSPVFNLVMDKGRECASPLVHDHNWLGGNVRWTWRF